jgi:hypothetical protein
MKKTRDLRKKYPQFIYQDFGWRYLKPNLKIWFDFSIRPNLNFKTKVLIKNINKKRIQTLKRDDLENLIFHLGLVEMLNYWKATCSPKISIEAGKLTRAQINFLKKIIIKGMGQYFYENKIDFTKKGFLKIESSKNKNLFKRSKSPLNKKKILIPIGGGKDTPVTIEFLKKQKGLWLGSFILNPRKPQIDIAKIANLKENIFVQREIDKKLLQLNKLGFLNSHVPFSAFLANLSLVIAILFDYGKIAFSWEKSSDEPNLKYKGRWVNHQWSKTSEFESALNSYAKKYLIENIEIFSPLRGLSELEIAQIFSKLKKYHPVFVSCNNPYKIEKGGRKWCQKCPKCLFVFALLYPFLEKKELMKIFGKNLFQDRKLLPLMEQLVGERAKPFECVGTKKETLLAFYLSLKKCQRETSAKLPFLLKDFEKRILPKYPNLQKEITKIFKKGMGYENRRAKR